MSVYGDNYRSPANESGKGNVNADIMEYTFTGSEAADTTVLMRRMNEYNKYMRIRIIPESGFDATTDIDIGYVSREDGVADNLVAFVDGAALDGGNVEAISDVVEVPYKHDLALTIRVNDAGNADHMVRLMVEFISEAG